MDFLRQSYNTYNSLVIPQARVKNFPSKTELTQDAIRKLINADDLEIALMLCISINTIASNKLRDLVDRIKASQTQEGRERYCYERNYLAKKKGEQNIFKSIVNATESMLDKFDKSLCRHLKIASEDVCTGFDIACSESISVVEENFEDIINASSRFFVSELAKMKDVPEDIWCYSDLLVAGLITEVNWEVYQFLFVRGQFYYVDYVPEYKFLNGNALLQQYNKIKDNIDLKASNGVDDAFFYNNIILKNEYTELKRDMCKILFSVENAKHLFEARGNQIEFIDRKSLIDGFDNNTYSLNYYKQHYRGAFPLKDIKRKKR